MTVDQSTFKSRNGDMLVYLELRMDNADQRLTKAQKKFKDVDNFIMKPLRTEVDEATKEKLSIAARLHSWWLEFREAQTNNVPHELSK